MPEPDKKNNSDDVVPKEDYNKIVEAHNSMKTEMEEKEKAIKEFEKKDEIRKVKYAEKKKWQKETEEKDKLKAELEAKKVKDDTVKRKGIVQQPADPKGTEMDATKKILDERFPTEYKEGDPQLMSPLERLKYFKKPSTRIFNKEKFGELLSLQGSAQVSDPNSLPNKFHAARGNPPPEMDKIKT